MSCSAWSRRCARCAPVSATTWPPAERRPPRKEDDMAEARIVRSAEGDEVAGVPWLFKAIGANTDGHFDLMVGEVGYLTGPPLHVHAEQDDSFFVLEGVLATQVGDEIVD